METGISQPELNKIVTIAKYFNVTTESLINDEIEIEYIKENINQDNQNKLLIYSEKLNKVTKNLLKISIVFSICYFFAYIFMIIFQKTILSPSMPHIEEYKMDIPVSNIIALIINTILYIGLSISIIKEPTTKKYSSYIIALILILLIPYILSVIINFSSSIFYTTSSANDIAIRIALTNYLARLSPIQNITLYLYLIACSFKIANVYLNQK